MAKFVSSLQPSHSIAILLIFLLIAYINNLMSDQEQFQSAQKQCSLEFINVAQNYDCSLTPRKRMNETNHQWKFEKIKRIIPTSLSPRKLDAKNISFQTDDMGQISDEDQSCNSQQKMSVFQALYKNCQKVYVKQKSIGTSWLGHKQYFASIFVNPKTLVKQDFNLFKQQPTTIPPSITHKNCIFDSNFQSGNLFTAYQVQKNEYDLLLQNDINSKGNTQWFYFQLSNLPARTKIKINIVNMLKSDSLFNYGMQPCIYSTEANKKNGQGWFRAGTNLKYCRSQNKVDGSNRFYYSLTFTIATPYEGDVLKISQCYPYTVSNLNRYLDAIEKKPGKKDMIRRQSAGKTIGKNNIEVIRIMEDNPRKKASRGLIFVTARQHPGQTPGSFVCEGFTDFILSDDKQAQYLRKNYQIVILPMINPDGVMVGNYRTNLCGLDLNRRWDGSKPKQALQSIFVKKYISEISKGREISFIVDLHGHSRKLFSFFYGNIGLQNPEEVRIYPFICAKMSDNMIRFEDSTFVCEEAKRRTARIQMFTKFKVPNIFTFQSSFFGYFNRNRDKVHYTQQKFMSMGVILGKSMFIHERYKNHPDCIEGLMVKKYLNQLKTKPELIKCGEKVGSGSESQPQNGQVKDLEYSQLETDDKMKEENDGSGKIKKKSKKDIVFKDIQKQSRQLHVMDIARVNSIFPNDVLALMPSSCHSKAKQKQKVVPDKHSVMVQTGDIPLIKIYDACKFQEEAGNRDEKSTKKKIIAIKGEGSTISKSNLFRTIVRPKSSSNSYLEMNQKNATVKKQFRKRHDSGYEMKQKKKINTYAQTTMTFSPTIDFMSQTLDSLIINPVSKGLQNLRTRTKFATLNPKTDSEPVTISETKKSSQSFKIGLRALNVETWRIKKKNFQ